MIPVPLHHAEQGVFRPPLGRLGEILPVGKLGPDQDARPVGGVVVARIGDLDVGAEEIEAHVLRLGELGIELLIAERRVDEIGIVVLVQRATQVEHLAVQQQVSRVRRGDGPHSEVRRQRVQRLGPVIVAVEQHGLQLVEIRMGRVPEHRLGHRNGHLLALDAGRQEHTMPPNLPLRIGHVEPEPERPVALGR